MASENKDKMAVDRRKIMAILVELRDEARRIGNRDARETAEDHIKQARLAKTEDDWLDLQTATHYIDEMMHSKPGKKDTMAVEDRFYFGKGRKAKMARNSEYDTDGVKNLIHKETRDAEWGIDLYKGARAGNQYHAYHAFIGESVTTRVFGSRSEAEAWLNKKNAAGHPNKRKNSRSGGKAKFANSNEVRAIVVGLDKAISSLSQLPGDQSIRGPIAKVIQQLIAVQESARRLS